MKELTEAEKQVTTETHELLVSLDEKQKELTEYQTNIVNMKKNASDLQTLIAIKQIENCFNNYFGKLLNTGGYILHTGVYLI
jgi:urate oxidase